MGGNRFRHLFPPIFYSPNPLPATGLHSHLNQQLHIQFTMKRYLLPALFLLSGYLTYAQDANEIYVTDALRYSYLQPGGTARFIGAGGAFGALGADFSTLSQNPAGLALFRSDELVVTPGLRFSNTVSNFPGSDNIEESKSNFNIGNAGIVFNTNPIGSRWTTFNVGIGFNRQNSFHQSFYYEGLAAGSIMNDLYASAVADFVPNGPVDQFDPFGAQLAYNTGAIYDPVINPGEQVDELAYDFATTPDAIINHAHSITTSGNMNEVVLSFAGNYDEKLMLGATIGVPVVNYVLDGTYEENDLAADQVQYFDRLQYTEYLRTQGVGVNMKLGLIYRPHALVRLGAAFHTPTLMGLTDNYYNTFTYEYTDGGGPNSNTDQSLDGTFDYRLRTPWRASGSAAFLFRKYGFISADVELVDYSASRYNFTADVSSTGNEQLERIVNRQIQNSYRQVVNLRFGGELALDQFRLRGGVNLLGKPNEGETGFNTAYSAGFGVRGNAFFIDLGYRLSKGQGSIRAPYAGSPTVDTDNTTSDLVLTLGLKF